MQLDHNKTPSNCDLIEEEGHPSIPNTHLGGYSYERQPFNIVRNFILFYLWAQRCHFRIQGIYMLQKNNS